MSIKVKAHYLTPLLLIPRNLVALPEPPSIDFPVDPVPVHAQNHVG